MIQELAAAVVAPEDAPTVSLLGHAVRLRLTGGQTGGSLAVFDYSVAPRSAGPPPHVHRNWDESFVVLEGELEFDLAGERVVAPAGTAVHVPHGTPHTYANPGGPARYLGIAQPAGFEGYFAELAAAFARAGGMPDPASLAALWEKYDTVPV